MKKTISDNQTRIIHGNTEIIIRELESEPKKSIFKVKQKKVAIRIDNNIYDFIIKHFGERGFCEFYHFAPTDLIKKMKNN